LGAETALTADDRRWLSPLPLWTGILAGPIAWSITHLANYALAPWSCSHQRASLLFVIPISAFVVAALGGLVASTAWRHTPADAPTDGGRPRQRARFMALLGMAVSAFFALTILAYAIPPWVLDVCD
jgi:hypothetical protein